MDSNAVERAIRPVTITRKNSLFAGSDAGARHWAIANTLIQTCKLNAVEPLAYLTDVLQRIVSGPREPASVGFGGARIIVEYAIDVTVSSGA